VCETVWFFRGWILIRLTWNWSPFVPNSVEILTLNFRKTLFWENFSEIFTQTKTISSTETCEISPYFLQFLFCVRIALKKFTQVLSKFSYTRVRRHVHKRITKRRHGEEKPGRFFFRKTSFVHSRSGNYYALLLGCFRLKFLPDILHCVYWVLAEIWAPDSSEKIGNKVFIDRCQGWKGGSFVSETSWFFSWVNTHPFELKFVAFVPNSVEILTLNFGKKNISEEFFRSFHANQGYPLPKLVKFRPTFCNFYSVSVLRWKNSHK